MSHDDDRRQLLDHRARMDTVVTALSKDLLYIRARLYGLEKDNYWLLKNLASPKKKSNAWMSLLRTIMAPVATALIVWWITKDPQAAANSVGQ